MARPHSADLPWKPTRQCVATVKSTGARCTRNAIKGGSVCVVHGGSVPHVIAAAKRRLLEASEPAIARLVEIIESRPGVCKGCGHVDPATGAKCCGCGRSDDNSTIVHAIRTLLDRCGLGPKMTIATEQQPEDLSQMSVAQLRARAHEILEMADYLEASGAAGQEAVEEDTDTDEATPVH